MMQRLLVNLANGHKLRPLLAPCSLSLQRVVCPQTSDKGISRLLQEVHHRVIEGILVLVQPACHRVANLERKE